MISGIRYEDKTHKAALNFVEKKVSGDMYSDILMVIDNSENCYDFEITDSPKGEFQEEDYHHLKGIWVDQNGGGFSGDSFQGTVSIEITKNEYLTFRYWM